MGSRGYRRRNPYREGTPAYLAYEFGYSDALEDVARITEENTFGGDTEETAEMNRYSDVKWPWNETGESRAEEKAE